MAQTALLIKNRKVVTKSHYEGDKLMALVTNADDNFSMINDNQALAFEVEQGDEADFHTGLRKLADAENQFVRQYSTNPEWNPENQPKPLSNEDRTPVQGC